CGAPVGGKRAPPLSRGCSFRPLGVDSPTMERSARMALGVVVERRRSRSPWQDAVWQPVSVLGGGAPLGAGRARGGGVGRRRSRSPGQDAVWQPVSVLVGAPPLDADWRELMRGEGWS